MDKDFEKQMKEKFSEASLKDIMPSFDKSGSWDELDNKLSKKKTVLPIWFNYAAAVVAGLLIGGGAIKMWWTDNATTQTIVQQVEVPVANPPIHINTPTQEVIKVDEPNKTVVAHTQNNNKHVDTDRKAIQQPTTKKEVAADTKENITTVVPSSNIDTLMTVKQPVVVKAPENPKKKTVHLLDIMNEDRTTVLNDASPNNVNISNIVRQLSPPQAPVSNKEDSRHLVIRTLLNN